MNNASAGIMTNTLTAIESNNAAGIHLSLTHVKKSKLYPTRNILASVPQPICSFANMNTKINRKELKRACHVPRLIPRSLDIPRLNMVHGSVPRLVLLRNDNASPIIITAHITKTSLLLSTLRNFISTDFSFFQFTLPPNGPPFLNTSWSPR